jgi:resuscitation-promoting factor RpfA
VRCPRCSFDNLEAAARCVHCGVPLALGREPTPQRLDRSLNLDRRGPVEAPAFPLPRPTGIESPAPPRQVEPQKGVATRLDPRRTTAPRAVAPAVAKPPQRQPEIDLAAEIPLDVGAMEIHLNRAPSWKRVSAWLVDGAIMGAFTGTLTHLAIGGTRALSSSAKGPDWFLDIASRDSRLLVSLGIVTALATFVYLTLGHALMGATLGKQLMGIRVIARNGHRPTLLRSAIRSTISIATLLVLGLGPLLSLFTRSGRALHDFLTGTYVVKRPPPS